MNYGKCSKIKNTVLLFSNKILFSQNTCQNSKQGRPWSDCLFRSSLILVCAVCLGHFGRQIVLEILEHLPLCTVTCWWNNKLQKIKIHNYFCSPSVHSQQYIHLKNLLALFTASARLFQSMCLPGMIRLRELCILTSGRQWSWTQNFNQKLWFAKNYIFDFKSTHFGNGVFYVW